MIALEAVSALEAVALGFAVIVAAGATLVSIADAVAEIAGRRDRGDRS